MSFTALKTLLEKVTVQEVRAYNPELQVTKLFQKDKWTVN